jgi:hypothetical protein
LPARGWIVDAIIALDFANNKDDLWICFGIFIWARRKIEITHTSVLREIFKCTSALLKMLQLAISFEQ